MSFPPNSLLAIALIFTTVLGACQKQDVPDKTYPYALEYKELSQAPTQWFVLTADAQTPITPPQHLAAPFDAEVNNALSSFDDILLFNRLEFLSDSTVNVRFFTGNNTFLDSIMPCHTEQGITKIIFGSSPGECAALRDGPTAGALTLGLTATVYSFKKANGTIDYGPVEFQYSNEQNRETIIQALRQSAGLQANDTVAVKLLGYIFE